MRPDVKVRWDVTACDVRAVTVYDDRLRKEGETDRTLQKAETL